MFKDEEFGAGHEFKNEFLSLLYCRIYIPKSEIIKYGETFPELYLIHKGIVLVYLKGGNKESFIKKLPTYSYFGDYQILNSLKS
jgi:signal-transduction protein with cAMP-binding, CBS, and nucleotidyltransferase domain